MLWQHTEDSIINTNANTHVNWNWAYKTRERDYPPATQLSGMFSLEWTARQCVKHKQAY